MGRGEAERGWWSRNWGWCVGCGCLVPILAIGGIAYGTFLLGNRLFDSNSALETAIARVNEDARAVEVLGSPIEPKLWRENTNISFSDDEMSARFGVTGPKGDARLDVRAHLGSGDDEQTWVLDRLLLYLDDGDEPIDLLGDGEPPGEERAAPADAA